MISARCASIGYAQRINVLPGIFNTCYPPPSSELSESGSTYFLRPVYRSFEPGSPARFIALAAPLSDLLFVFCLLHFQDDVGGFISFLLSIWISPDVVENIVLVNLNDLAAMQGRYLEGFIL